MNANSFNCRETSEVLRYRYAYRASARHPSGEHCRNAVKTASAGVFSSMNSGSVVNRSRVVHFYGTGCCRELMRYEQVVSSLSTTFPNASDFERWSAAPYPYRSFHARSRGISWATDNRLMVYDDQSRGMSMKAPRMDALLWWKRPRAVARFHGLHRHTTAVLQRNARPEPIAFMGVLFEHVLGKPFERIA